MDNKSSRPKISWPTYRQIPVEEKERCSMCGDTADIVYVPTSTPLCLSCKAVNDDIIRREQK